MISVKEFEFGVRIAHPRFHPENALIKYPINLVDPVLFKD